MTDTGVDTVKNRNAIKSTLEDGYRKNVMSIHSIH